MMKKPVENFKATQGIVAQRILSSNLANYIGYHDLGDNGGMTSLKRAVAGQNDERDISNWNFISLTFRGAGTNCSLSAEMKTKQLKYCTDDAGNEWSLFNLEFTVNWPCHGTLDPAQALAVLNFQQRCAMLAAELHAEFGGGDYWKITSTKLEREEAAKANARAEMKRKAIAAIEANAGRLKVGAGRWLGHLVAGFADGEYKHEMKDRKYTMFVTAGQGNLVRTA